MKQKVYINVSSGSV